MAPKSSRKSASKSKTPKIDPNSSFTPEAFEKELKALASKAKDETWGKFLREQASAYLKAAALLAVAAVYSNVSQLALSPVYGSIPSSIWHPHLVMVGCFTGWASNLHLGRLLPVKLIYLLPIIAINIPLVQFYLYKASTTLAAFYGPLVTEALTLLPLLVIATSCTANTLDNADFSKLPRWLADATPGMISWGFFKLVEAGSGRLIEPQIGKSFFQTRLGLEMILGVTTALLAPSRLLIHAMPGVLHTAVLNTHVYSPIATANLNGTLNLEGWSLIDRKESLTGYISVVDSHAQGFRVLRCDHSLLGGEWIKYKGPRVAEPIYSVFAMLEAVRLVEGKNRVADHEANALVV